jgi:AraC-like DNA-binding protein
MPLFMDLHKASDYDVKPTVEEIKRNHIADLEVQHKYSVKFLQYWINEEAGLVFCLMEAPDKEACAAVHREAHGAMPCNVIELKGGDYMALIGEGVRKNEFDIVETADGRLDAGYRIIMVIDILSLNENVVPAENLLQLIKNAGGQTLGRPASRKAIVFMPGAPFIHCALNIIKSMESHPGEIRIGISAGEPVTDSRELFNDAIQSSNRFCDIAQNGQVLVASLALNLAGAKDISGTGVRVLNTTDEIFLRLVNEAVQSLSSEQSFNIDVLSKQLGVSRSQLYRKFKDLTGSSTNSYLQELRLRKAFELIRSNYGNITQVAMEAGFGNLSYFAKSFQKRFGITPLKAAKLNA